MNVHRILLVQRRSLRRDELLDYSIFLIQALQPAISGNHHIVHIERSSIGSSSENGNDANLAT